MLINNHRGVVAMMAGAVLAAAPCTANAQTVSAGQVNPGAINRQTQEIQRDAGAPLPVPGSQTQGVVAPALPAPLTLSAGGATVTLRSVEFTPTELLAQADLDAIAAGAVARPLDLAGLQNIANAVNALYAKGGYVTASAILPAQDLASGVLRVQLIEGRVGNVVVNGRQTLRRGLLQTAVPLEPNAVVSAPALTRDVDRFNRTGTAQIQAALQPGASFGLTDINLAVVEPRRNTLQVFADNLGVESVGEYEVGGLFQHYGLLGLDDRFTAYGLYAEGNLFGNVAYNLAVSPYGTRAGISYSRSAIRIVGGPFSDLDVDGTSQIGSLNLSHPLYSGGPFLLLGNLAGSLAESSTDQSDVTVTDDFTRKETVGLSGNYFGEVFSLTLSPSVSFGQSDLRIVDQDLDFTLFQLNGTASLRLDDRTLFVGRGSMQVSSDELLPGSELFQIGGPATVRGYPTSSASGDAGYVLNFELYHSLDRFVRGLEAFAFVDTGSVYSEFPSRVTMVSAGAGVNYSWNDRIRGELSFGIPLDRDVVPDQGDGTIYARLVATLF